MTALLHKPSSTICILGLTPTINVHRTSTTNRPVLSITDSDKSRAFDPRKMMQRIDESPQRSYDMADKELANLYGDIWNFKMPNYEFGEPPEPIEVAF